MDIRQFFFKFRGFTPVPLVLVVIVFARPSVPSLIWGILLMVGGELIRIWGVAYAGGATRTRNVGAHQLVTNGPFARVRNPLYVGNMLMYTGAAVTAGIWLPWLVIATWVFFGLQYYFIIQLEEEKLIGLFGREYEEYCQRVPRLIPRLRPAKSANPVQPDLPSAIRSEKSTFFSFTAIVVLMVGKMFYILSR